LRSRFVTHVIPIDTVRAVTEVPGLVRRRVFRPSQSSILAARYASLSPEEARMTEALVDDAGIDLSVLAPLPLPRRAVVLESAHDLLLFRSTYNLTAPSPEGDRVRAQSTKLLQARSTLGVSTAPPAIAEPPPPEEQHDTARVEVGVGMMPNARVFEEVSYRWSLHDLLDNPRGYRENAQIVLPELRVRVEPQRLSNERQRWNTVTLERLQIFDVTSIQPVEGWFNMPSWRAALGSGRVLDLGCRSWRCIATQLAGGPGYAVAAQILGRETAYGFLDLDMSTGPAFAPNYRIGAGATLGLVLQWASMWRVHGEARYRFDALGDVRAGRNVWTFEVGTSVSFTRNTAVRLVARRDRTYGQAVLALDGYL
jgi:hypothetical protein